MAAGSRVLCRVTSTSSHCGRSRASSSRTKASSSGFPPCSYGSHLFERVRLSSTVHLFEPRMGLMVGFRLPLGGLAGFFSCASKRRGQAAAAPRPSCRRAGVRCSRRGSMLGEGAGHSSDGSSGSVCGASGCRGPSQTVDIRAVQACAGQGSPGSSRRVTGLTA